MCSIDKIIAILSEYPAETIYSLLAGVYRVGDGLVTVTWEDIENYKILL